MELYDDYDEFYCQDLIPLSNKLAEFSTDGDRCHYMLAFRLATTQAARWLIKPETGFIDDVHKRLFATSYKENVKHLKGFFLGKSGYQSGKVYVQLDADPELEVVADAIQPIRDWTGKETGKETGYDEVRNVFEKWHLSGASLRTAWNTQQVVAKVMDGDKMAALGIAVPLIQARYPGWIPATFSSPPLPARNAPLNLGSLI